MPPFAISIKKSFQFRGVQEETSNVYHYDYTGNDANHNAILDALIPADRACHSPGFQYKEARVWGPTNQGPEASQTRLIRDLSGAGTMVVQGADVYRELCMVLRIFVGRYGTKNRKQYLRKYFHLTSMPGSGSNYIGSEASVGSSNKTPYITALNSVRSIILPLNTQVFMCTPNGNSPNAQEEWKALDVPHIRQLKQ